MMGKKVQLNHTWEIGPEIGSGGFGKVYSAESSDGRECVAKLVPKAQGADRELLFVDLPENPNIIPILDSGEFEHWLILVMPRAECSLDEHLEASGGVLSLAESVQILKDICSALVALGGQVVHRDLKPANVLQLDGRWCLSDFGISRYAEATTSEDTRKFALSPPYAAPERWRHERATSAADIYGVGVMGYEMVSGHRPFEASSIDEYREKHLHVEPAPMKEVPAALGALIDECLYKAAEARPTPANLYARLERVSDSASTPGLSALEEANREEVLKRQEATRKESEARSEAERRKALADAGQRSYDRISDALRTAIEAAAPTARVTHDVQGGWSIKLGDAEITMTQSKRCGPESWSGRYAPSLEVVLAGVVSVRIPEGRDQYEGRSHSLWFCDAKEEGNFGWYETAFMVTPLMSVRGRQDPFALNPGEEAAKALSNVLAEYQVAWPLTEISLDNSEDFLDRWAGWFAEAAQGNLTHPRSMPERDPGGSWRRP